MEPPYYAVRIFDVYSDLRWESHGSSGGPKLRQGDLQGFETSQQYWFICEEYDADGDKGHYWGMGCQIRPRVAKGYDDYLEGTKPISGARFGSITTERCDEEKDIQVSQPPC